uniref:Uncharacterized protein n=1 Tax=Caenorhabditis japonica TaxID=281687 RepID=A0A8R1I9B4_CAEJA
MPEDISVFNRAAAMNTIASLKQCVISDLQIKQSRIQEIASLSADRLEALEERVTNNTNKLDALLLNTEPIQQGRERHDSTSGSDSVPTRSPQPQGSTGTSPNDEGSIPLSVNVLGLKMGSRIPTFAGAPNENLSSFVRSFMDQLGQSTRYNIPTSLGPREHKDHTSYTTQEIGIPIPKSINARGS